MKEMVLGYMFSQDRRRVVLIRKNRPEWQAGQLNGIGGKIEEFDADPAAAMRREFREEAGLDIDTWEHGLTFTHYRHETHPGTIHVFRAFGDVDTVTSVTDEKVEVFDVDSLPAWDGCMKNTVHWMLRAMLDEKVFNGHVTVSFPNRERQLCPSSSL